MQCPKCGTENPDDAQICDSCSYNLTSTSAADSTRKTKSTIKAAFLRGLIIGILYFILMLLSTVSTVVLFLTVIVIILNTIKIVNSFNKAKVPPKFRFFPFRTIFIGPNVLLVWMLLLSIDASPIPNDYTIADLRSAPADCAHSYELLKSLADKKYYDSNDAPAIGLSEQDITLLSELKEVINEADWSKISQTLEEKSEDIILAWNNAKKGREIINELNKFGEIADLTEPNFGAYNGFLTNLRELGFLHRAYARLQTKQGSTQIAAGQLIDFDSVIRKLGINARTTITKLQCYSHMGVDIQTANFIINNPQTSQESLELLARHFAPLEIEQISLRNQLITEYLTFKNILYSLPFLRRSPQVRNLPFIKRNSTLRVSRNWFNDLICTYEKQQTTKSEELSVWPWIYPDLGPVDLEDQFPWYYKSYNPVGSTLLEITALALGRVFEIKTNLEVHCDLLHIVLNKRLGKEISLKARAYSDEYIIDLENKKIFNPGPDGQPHTEDDIKLIINPEVLGFSD